MKKLFVVSDVHSFYTQLIKVLNEKGFDKNNPEHWFVSCGDLLDRGPESQQCYGQSGGETHSWQRQNQSSLQRSDSLCGLRHDPDRLRYERWCPIR